MASVPARGDRGGRRSLRRGRLRLPGLPRRTDGPRVRAPAARRRGGRRAILHRGAARRFERGGRVVRPRPRPQPARPPGRCDPGLAAGARHRARVQRRPRRPARRRRGQRIATAAPGAAPGPCDPRPRDGRAVRSAGRRRLEALLREGREPRRRAPGTVSFRLPAGRLDLRALAATHRRGERQRRPRLHHPPAGVLPRVQGMERRSPGAAAVAGPRRVGGAAAAQRLRRPQVESPVPLGDAPGRGGRTRARGDRCAGRARVGPLRRRRRRSRPGVHHRPRVGAVLHPRLQQAATRPHRLRGPLPRGRPGDAHGRLDGRAV